MFLLFLFRGSATASPLPAPASLVPTAALQALSAPEGASETPSTTATNVTTGTSASNVASTVTKVVSTAPPAQAPSPQAAPSTADSPTLSKPTDPPLVPPPTRLLASTVANGINGVISAAPVVSPDPIGSTATTAAAPVLSSVAADTSSVTAPVVSTVAAVTAPVVSTVAAVTAPVVSTVAAVLPSPTLPPSGSPVTEPGVNPAGSSAAQAALRRGRAARPPLRNVSTNRGRRSQRLREERTHPFPLIWLGFQNRPVVRFAFGPPRLRSDEFCVLVGCRPRW